MRMMSLADGGTISSSPAHGAVHAAGRYATILAVNALVFLTASLAFRAVASGHGPFSNMYEFSLAFAWGALAIYLYFEMRYKMQAAMEAAEGVFTAVDAEFAQRFGRGYGIIEEVRTDDADVVLITTSTMTSMARLVIDKLRDEGISIGLIKIKMFRPFPRAEIRKALSGKKRAIVIDRNISFGKGGIFADEIQGAIANDPDRPPVYGTITGLGGRDVTCDAIEEIVRDCLAMDAPPESGIVWKGVRI